MKNRLIQFHSSSSFHSLSQNIPFYQSTITPLKPYLGKGICKISHSIALYNSAKIRTESGKTKRLYKSNRNCCCCVFFFLFVFQATSDALGTKTFRGLLHDIRMSFVQERVHTGCHTITSVKFIRNESFLSEFIGVFITERNTHSGQPFLPV